MTTLIPRIPIPPRCSRFLLEARNRANAPSGTAIRSARSTLPSIQRTPRSPVAVLIYSTPAASVRTNQHFKALLSTAAGKPKRPSAHTPPPIRPRLITEPAMKPGSAPGPLCGMPPAAIWGTRRAVPTHAVSPALVFPPWNPPFRGAPFQKGNPPGGKTHPGGHSTALFCLSVATLHSERIPDLPKTAVPEHAHCLGGRHHSAALPIPPTPQGIRAHRPFYELSPVCPASCFGGQGRSATGTLAAHTVADSPRNRLAAICH